MAEIASDLALMVFELFILTAWLKHREKTREKKLWEPFRALLLGTIVRHLSDLNMIGRIYVDEVGEDLRTIRDAGSLSPEALKKLSTKITSLVSLLQNCKQAFFFGLQTAAPSLKPETADYCREAFFFGQTLEQDLSRAAGVIGRLEALPDLSNEATERLLSELKAIKLMMEFMLGQRFSNAKTNFVQSVWKQEQLHYYEPDDTFYSPKDYKTALEAERLAAKLKSTPRTTPVRNFFDRDDESAAVV